MIITDILYTITTTHAMNNSTNKPFGIRGTLFPKELFDSMVTNISHGDMCISVSDGIFEVGFDKEEDKVHAEKIARDIIASWSFRNNTKATIEFNQSWKQDSGVGHTLEIMNHEDIQVSDRAITTTATILGLSYVVKPISDSYDFENDADIIINNSDATLTLILQYYYNEVLGADRPKVGIYRIIEALTSKIGDRDALSKIIGEKKKYVDDIMQTTQEHRHSPSQSGGAKVVLSEQECINRVKKLIQAYIDSIA